jgi:hypothetical protein
MTEINRTYSLRIRLMLVKKTIPGIIMNPITKTLNTIVQLSPIYAPLNLSIRKILIINPILIKL